MNERFIVADVNIYAKHMAKTTTKDVVLDETDLCILRTLQNESRTQYRQLAEETGKSLGTVCNRIQRLTDARIITSWNARVNPEKVGYDLTVLIHIQIDISHLDAIGETLAEIPELFTLYNTTGTHDIMAIGRFYNRQHLDETLHVIMKTPHVERTHTSIALRVLKEDTRVHLP